MIDLLSKNETNSMQNEHLLKNDKVETETIKTFNKTGRHLLTNKVTINETDEDLYTNHAMDKEMYYDVLLFCLPLQILVLF